MISPVVEHLCRVIADSKEVAEKEKQWRAKSWDSYVQRLQTFRTPWWFNRPQGISPIDCARHGWINSGPNLLECETCFAELHIESVQGVHWLVNASPGPAGRGTVKEWTLQIMQRHGPFCPWRSEETLVADPNKLPTKEILESVRNRFDNMCASLKYYPILLDDTPETQVLQILACAGWENNDSLIDEGGQLLERLRCVYCLRIATVQSFKCRRTQHASLTSESVKRQSSYLLQGPPLKSLRCQNDMAHSHLTNSEGEAGAQLLEDTLDASDRKSVV